MKTFYTLLILAIYFNINAQNTVGLLTLDSEASVAGINLIFPFDQSDVFLINECGQVVHKWEGNNEFGPGTTAYLLPNGNLLKSKKPRINTPGNFSNGGAGGIVDIYNWNNEKLYSITVLDSLERLHHDICPLPNGNFLAIAWERKNTFELIEAGRDTSLNNEMELWPDKVIEVNPFLDSIVWEWNLWDHLIQDFNNSKSNFGIVSESPGKIDVNFDRLGFAGRSDFAHINSIDYNPHLDQILLSSPFFAEIWIIDHSTSMEEAASSQGGIYNKGGDLLYRWGNPRAFKNGNFDDQKLFFQHNARWVINPLLEDSRYWSMISLFNNRVELTKSEVNFINPAFDNVNNTYLQNDNVFLPSTFEYTISLPIPELSHSTSMSSVQVLKDDNLLICASQTGYIFELNVENDLVWAYRVPLRNGTAVEQGSILNLGDNVLFDTKRYSYDFEAFDNFDFTLEEYLELDPEITFCEVVDVFDNNGPLELKLYPNPFSSNLIVESNDTESLNSITIYNVYGVELFKQKAISKLPTSLDLSFLMNGLYFVSINGSQSRAVLKF